MKRRLGGGTLPPSQAKLGELDLFSASWSATEVLVCLVTKERFSLVPLKELQQKCVD